MIFPTTVMNVVLALLTLGAHSALAMHPDAKGNSTSHNHTTTSHKRKSGPSLIDLTHVVNNETETSPGGQGALWPYEQDVVNEGPWRSQGNIWYANFNFRMAEHGGTHMDAPYHFSETGWTVHEIPLERLVRRPAVVVNITERAMEDPNAQLTIDDLEAWETEYGRIPDGAVVLMNSGWAAHYTTPMFFNVINGASHTPTFTVEAIQWLVANRTVYGIGVDTPSIEKFVPGVQPVALGHRTIADANIFAIENGANFGAVPASGAMITCLPLPFENGSGAPTRIYAELDQGNGSRGSSQSSYSLYSLLLAGILTIQHLAL